MRCAVKARWRRNIRSGGLASAPRWRGHKTGEKRSSGSFETSNLGLFTLGPVVTIPATNQPARTAWPHLVVHRFSGEHSDLSSVADMPHTSHQNELLRRAPLVLWTAAVLCVLSGCQNPRQAAWPWPAPGATASQPYTPPGTVPQVAANTPDLEPDPRDTGVLRDLLKRQSEQSRLSEEQSRELARLTELYQRQQQKLRVADRGQAQSKVQDHLEKLREQSALLKRQQRELAQTDELRRRTLELDSNNRDLHRQLAQSQQQSRLLEDQIKLIRRQLEDTAAQLAGAMDAKASAEQRVTAMQTTLQKRGGATIQPNNSVQNNLTAIQIAGLTVRQDGDVVRIELPSDEIFMPRSASLTQQSQLYLDQVAAAVAQHYPRQKIGIEAHTDATPLAGSQWRNNHQLSAAQAQAVFDDLTSRGRLASRQLFVLGHGPNYPVASNNSPAGQQRNRRVEVVIYPDAVR